jgi:8-oxo-dGTP pyrophosphatase MutT (NUDIX family)
MNTRERPETALVRELKEELGIKVWHISLLWSPTPLGSIRQRPPPVGWCGLVNCVQNLLKGSSGRAWW